MNKKLTADMKRVRAMIAAARTIVLATHENPDGDGLGSLLALSSYLASIKKKHISFVSGTVPGNLSFLPRYASLVKKLPERAPDLLIGFDYGDYRRLALPYALPRAFPLITLDHHPKDKQEGEVNIVEPSFSSTAELTYRFFTANRIPLTPHIATCLYTGIVTDTGGFVHRNTTPATFAAVSDLLAHTPLNTEYIAKQALGFPSHHAALVTGLALSRIMVDKKTRIAYSYLSWRDLAKHKVAWEDVDTVVNLMNFINNDGVKCVALFKERNDGMIAVSLRSDAKKAYDARALAHALGGGGHRFAAATRIKGALPTAMKKVFAQARAMQR